MTSRIKTNKDDIDVGIMIIQPTKTGIEEIGNSIIRLPNRTINSKQKSSNAKEAQITKPNMKKVQKATTKTKTDVNKKEERVEGK